MPVAMGDNVTQNSSQMVNITPLIVTSATATPTVTSLNDQMQKTNETPHFLKQGTDHVAYNEVNYRTYGSENPFTAYRANLTYPYNQIQSQGLLLFLDPNYPVYTHGPTREQQIKFYVRQGTVVPRIRLQPGLILPVTNGKSVGDQLLMEIDLDPGVSTHIVDPYMTSVESRSPENITCVLPKGKCVVPDIIGVTGWVDTR